MPNFGACFFVTSKAILDIQYSKFCVRVASRQAARRKTYQILGNVSSRNVESSSSFPSTSKTSAMSAKSYEEKDAEVSWFCRI